MREFSADYLDRTRRGMWSDSREALSDLELDSRERTLDVGCGSGELTRILAEETPGDVVGVDADTRLLSVASEYAPVVAGDATRLPFPDGAFDLVVCQALLINLPDPIAAVEEFARVSSELVAAVEPDNSAVSVRSTVADESDLDRRAREAYIDGVATDVTLGGRGTRSLFETAGIGGVTTKRYDHDRTVEPPYSEAALDDARRKATGSGLDERRPTLESGSLSEGEYDDLRSAWREMGRDVIRQMQTDDYERTEIVPFYATVGRVEE